MRREEREEGRERRERRGERREERGERRERRGERRERRGEKRGEEEKGDNKKKGERIRVNKVMSKMISEREIVFVSEKKKRKKLTVPK